MPTGPASKTINRDPDWQGPAVAPGEMLLEEFLNPLGSGRPRRRSGWESPRIASTRWCSASAG